MASSYISHEKGLQIIADAIKNSTTHVDYKHVKELALLYKQLITGDQIELLLKRFVRREDDTLFKQRKELTQAITPSVSATIMNPFYKVGRSNNIIKKWIYKNAENPEEVTKNIGDAVLKYNGERSLDSYLETRFVELSFTDPNAFIITEFDAPVLGSQNQLLERVQPRPFECSSENAINFHYKNNDLKWLLVRLPIKYKVADKYKDGHSYTLYLENLAIKFTQVEEGKVNIKEGGFAEVNTVVTDGSLVNATYYNAGKGKLFIVETFEHKAGVVPAIRVGYKRDLKTDGRTCVNPMHEAMPYFLKSIKTVSEFDLTMALHAFPQKFQYVGRCTDKECDDGLCPDGTKCSFCGGTGYQIHASTQDAVVMRLPKKDEDLRDLTKLVHYVYPPIELLQFQKEFITELEIKARKAVFNSEVFSKTEVTQTATESRISMESVYDTLYPFAEKYSSVYRLIVTLIASLRDVKNLEVIHKFPKDFKFKTLDELLLELKIANESNAPSYVRSEISMDIAEQQFIDKPEELSRIKVKQKFYPFSDKSKEEILYLLSNNKTTKFNEVLYAHFDQIFNEIELEQEDFYKMAYEKQKALIKQKVDSIVIEIEEEQPQPSIGFNNQATEETAI